MIPQINKSIWGLFFLVFGRVTLLVAQPAIDLNAYQTKYKDDDIVFLKDEEECTIDLSGNEVKIKTALILKCFSFKANHRNMGSAISVM